MTTIVVIVVLLLLCNCDVHRLWVLLCVCVCACVRACVCVSAHASHGACRYSTLACKRLENVQVSCRLGALGLAQRLAPLTNLLDPEMEAAITTTGIESLDALVRCQKKVAKMIEIIQLKRQGAARGGGGDLADGSGGDDGAGGRPNEQDAVLNGTRPHINNIRVQTLAQQRKNEELQPVAKPDLIAAVVGVQNDPGVDEDEDSDGDEVIDIAQLRAMMKEEAQLIATGKKKVAGPAPKVVAKRVSGVGGAGAAAGGAQPDMA